jgi:hypothetical protein
MITMPQYLPVYICTFSNTRSVTCGRSVVLTGTSDSSIYKIDHHDITEILLKVALTIITPYPKLTKKEKMVWRYKKVIRSHQSKNRKYNGIAKGERTKGQSMIYITPYRNLKSNRNHGIILRLSGRVGSSCYACDTRLSFSCKMTRTSSDMVIALHNCMLK